MGIIILNYPAKFSMFDGTSSQLSKCIQMKSLSLSTLLTDLQKIIFEEQSNSFVLWLIEIF